MTEQDRILRSSLYALAILPLEYASLSYVEVFYCDTFLIEVFTQSGIAIVTIVAAYAVITGRGITVGNFSTLISSVSGVIKLGQVMGNFYISLLENHTMLKQISCIINDEDIGYDGGVDSFGSIHTGILEKEKQVASKFKHALHITTHHHLVSITLIHN